MSPRVAGPSLISSSANPRVREAAALRDRAASQASGLTLVEGVREVHRALLGGATVERVFVGPSATRTAGGRAAVAALDAARIPRIDVVGPALARLAFGDRDEGLVAVVRIPTLELADLRLPADPLVLVLEGVEKPGNLGAALRSADGAGADAVVAADPRTDLLNPNAIRASLGTIFTVPLACAASGDTLTWCRSQRLRIVAARVDTATSYADIDLSGPIAFVLGSEASGLSTIWDVPDVTACRLPMLGVADSLNVSVTAAVLLYEARRQRDAAGRRS